MLAVGDQAGDARRRALRANRRAPVRVVIVNTGHPEGNDDLEKVLSATMAEVFPTVLRDPIEETNTLLVGTNAPASAENLERAAVEMPLELQKLAGIEAARPGRGSRAAPSTRTKRRRWSG